MQIKTAMTIAKQLALVLVKEIIADKRHKHIAPDYALRNEINSLVGQALDALVDDGSLVQRSASVNRYPAYEIPLIARGALQGKETPCQPAL